MGNDLSAIEDRLDEMARARLVFLADVGYAFPGDAAAPLIELGLAWDAGWSVYPTDAGVRVAHDLVAQEVLSLPMAAGRERTDAQNRLYRLTAKLKGAMHG